MRSGRGPSAPDWTISRASGPCTAIIAQSSMRSLTRACGKSTATDSNQAKSATWLAALVTVR